MSEKSKFQLLPSCSAKIKQRQEGKEVSTRFCFQHDDPTVWLRSLLRVSDVKLPANPAGRYRNLLWIYVDLDCPVVSFVSLNSSRPAELTYSHAGGHGFVEVSCLVTGEVERRRGRNEEEIDEGHA